MCKRLLSFLLVFCLAFSNVVVTYGATSTAKVMDCEGSVKVKRAGSSKEFDAFENMTIQEGDQITTGTDGSVTIVVNDENYITAGKSTSFTINKLNKINKEPESSYTLHYGSVKNDVNKKGYQKDSYKVSTSNTVMGVRGTVFEVGKKIEENGEENVGLITLDGNVVVSNRQPSEDGTNSLVEVGSVTSSEQINFNNDDEQAGQVVTLDLSDLDADQLRWVQDNDEYLSEDQIAEVEENIVIQEQVEQEKQEKIEEAINDNSESNREVIEIEDDTDETNSGGSTDLDRGDYDVITPEVDPVKPDIGDIDTVTPEVDPVKPDIGDVGTLTPEVDPIPEITNYEVGNADELMYLDKILQNDANVIETITIVDDIDMAGKTDWVPVELDGVTLEGNGHTISNLSITEDGETVNASGLFSVVTNSTIQNLSLDNIVIDEDNIKYVGALAGEVTGSNISNITVDNSNINAKMGSGGVIGSLEGSNINNITVTNTIVRSQDSSSCAGGIIGYDNGGSALNDATVNNVNVFGYTSGGVFGYLGGDSTIENISVMGTSIGRGEYTTVAGGVVGKASTGTTINNGEGVVDTEINGASAGKVVGEGEKNCTITNVPITNVTVNGTLVSEELPSNSEDIVSPEVGVYEVSSPDNLMVINRMLLQEDNDITRIELTDDIDMKGEQSWVPAELDGVFFEGNGHEISNLDIKDYGTTSKGTASGLFSEVKNSTIQNLELDNIDINSNNTRAKYVGALTGIQGENSTINNISLEDSSVEARKGAGGLVGYLEDDGTISDVDIKNTDISSGGGAGSLVSETGENCTIKNINVKDATVSASMAGGVVGELGNNSEINSASVDNVKIYGSCLGGIVGDASANCNIKNATVDNNVFSGTLIGAIAGGTSSININNITIKLKDNNPDSIIGKNVGTTYIGDITLLEDYNIDAASIDLGSITIGDYNVVGEMNTDITSGSGIDVVGQIKQPRDTNQANEATQVNKVNQANEETQVKQANEVTQASDINQAKDVSQTLDDLKTNIGSHSIWKTDVWNVLYNEYPIVVNKF